MKYIITLIFIFLMSSFNFPMMNMNMNEMSLSKIEMSNDCHEEMKISSKSCEIESSCSLEHSGCSNQCFVDCAQSVSFIITKTNNIKIKSLSESKLVIYSQLYQSMTLSNLFRPPIA